MVIEMTRGIQIQAGTWKSTCSPNTNDKGRSGRQLAGRGFGLVVLCLMSQMWMGEVLSGKDAVCGDTMRTELYFRDRNSAKYAESREFLWPHWTTKKCGDLFLTTWSLEGVRTDSHYKITPVRPDAVVLTVTLARSANRSAPADGGAAPLSRNTGAKESRQIAYSAYTVDRIDPSVPYDLATAKAVQGVLPPSKYKLRFKDKDGKAITDF